MPYRLTHMLLASGLTVAFLIAGISAFRRLVGDRSPGNATTLRFGIVLGALLIPVQIFVGDHHGLNTLEYQPQKVAAMEGNWETGPAKPLLLFAVPDEAARTNHYEIGIPHGASLILTHEWDGIVPGLNDFVAEDGTVLHPPVAPVFFSFRIMVGMGMLMLLTSWAGVVLMRRRRAGVEGLPQVYLYGLVAMAFSGWVATLAGWYTTEIGRQPWLVTGVLTTKQAVADVPAPMVLGTLVMYLAVYAALIVAYVGVIFYLARKYAKGEHVGMVPPSSAAQVAMTAAE
jgi:cytochrome d ubiquinol oxidase subunit I